MGYWGAKNWKKINEGKASKKTQEAFITAYRKLRSMKDAENSQGREAGTMVKLSEDPLPSQRSVEGVQGKDSQGTGEAV